MRSFSFFIYSTFSSAPLTLSKCGPAPQGITVRLYLKEANKIITLDLEEYVMGVVATEMPANFHPEALKAQAVWPPVRLQSAA